MTLFGTSAKYIDALGKAGLDPKSSHDLSTLRLLTSTGSPLMPEGFDYVYEHIKQDICLSSIAGGLEPIPSVVGGTPSGHVSRAELQLPSLDLTIAALVDAVCGERER